MDNTFRGERGMIASVLFENPKNMTNVEMMARTCDFYGFNFYATHYKQIGNKDASEGVIKHKPVIILSSIAAWPWLKFCKVIITDSSFTTNPSDIELTPGDLIVFGNEAHGISDLAKSLATHKIGIKNKGIVPCLNVTVACGSILALMTGDKHGQHV